MAPVIEGVAGTLMMLFGFLSACAQTRQHAIATRWGTASLATLGLALLMLAVSTTFPVTMDMRATVVTSEPGRIDFEMVGNKVRPCQFLTIDAYTLRGDMRARAAVEFLNDPGLRPGQRPTGYNHFGTWRVSYDGSWPDAVSFMVTHDCGLPRPVMTEIGPFETPAITH